MEPDAADRIRALAASQEGLVTVRQAMALGVSRAAVDSEIRARRWMGLLRGVYLVDADLYADGLAPCVWWRAALLAHGRDTCLVASTAVRTLGLHGLPLCEEAVEIAWIGGLPRQRRRNDLRSRPLCADGPEVVVRQIPVAAHEVVMVNRFPIRRCDRSVIDAALNLDRPGALSLLDSGLHRNVLTPEQLLDAIDAAKGRPGIQQLRELAALADGRAESTVESRVRLACIDASLAPDELQYVVRNHDGHVVAIGDLGWHKNRRRPLLAEADGESVHAAPKAVFRDRWRGNALAGECCDTVRFTFADSLRPYYISSVVRAALNAG